MLTAILVLALICPLRADAKDPAAETLPTALQEYVAAKDDAFAWEIREKKEQNGCLVYDIDLTSQIWQGITWKHAMSAFVPEGVEHTDIVLLFIMGGRNGNRPDDGDLATGSKLATIARMPVAFLYQVPNQPLLGNKVEDDLISETFLRYLDTKDAKWPLLFPMAKSAVKAMDAVREIAQQEHGVSIDRFVVTGGSKRGWTTWLSAVADKRVAGIAPIVIDTLNFRPQMKHQMDTWGEYSEQIADYTSKGLVDVMEKHPEIPLWRWVDPFTYRNELKLPKLLINGTNDRYWVIDALNLYWNDLVGPKHVFYVPNAGHGLDEGRDAALTTLAVFAQHVALERPMPALTWLHEDDGNRLRLSVRSDPAPKGVKLWVAHSDDKDFRPDRWNATELTANSDGAYVGTVEKPAAGHVAFFAEATYEYGPLQYGLSTQIRQE
jgi:PhoPQ-activated pathogenicity-related protein